IFIHDNQMVANLAGKDYTATNNDQSFNAMIHASRLHHTGGQILAKNKEKLERKGFKVVKVPGVVWQFNKKNTYNNYEMISNFMNGYAGHGKRGNFYITL